MEVGIAANNIMVAAIHHHHCCRWLLAAVRRRRSFYLFVLVALACTIRVSAFTTHHHYDTTTAMYAVQDRLLDGLRSKWENGESNRNNDENESSPTIKDTAKQRVPFIIQRLGRGNEKDIKEITKMCVEVFFNEQEGAVNKVTTPWKSLQLAYLGNLQREDIQLRNAFGNKGRFVDLIVARRVYSVEDGVSNNVNGKEADVIIESDCQIFNAEQLSSRGGGESRLVIGEIIGYCEMMEKKFGLGGNFEGNDPNDTEEKLRPYLGNLSVAKYARFSGVGSKLLDECEAIVSEWGAGHTEIVLQVEEDNTSAIQFYKRRGWEFVFADPTCRRYDTSGFFLKESRITKYAMIKRLDQRMKAPGQNGFNNGENATGESILDKLRNSFFVKK